MRGLRCNGFGVNSPPVKNANTGRAHARPFAFLAPHIAAERSPWGAAPRSPSPGARGSFMVWQKGGGKNRSHSAAFRRLCQGVLFDEPTCRKCPKPSVEVDHITPLFEGGGNDRINLQALCVDCHLLKTAQESARARGVREPTRLKKKQTIGLDGWPIEPE